MNPGWFKIEGVQIGTVTFEDQMAGIWPALQGCEGKTVLDIGCAEGLIGREFARAGAIVRSIDSNPDILDVAREQCPDVQFELANLNKLAKNESPDQYDIVLSLGVCHKLKFPGEGVRFSARSSRDLVVFGFSAREEFNSGLMRSKHYPENTCNVYEIMEECGFRLEKILPRSRQETAQYYRRK